MKMITEDLLQRIYAIVGQNNCTIGADIGTDYCHDELPGGAAYMPELVVDVASTEQVSKILAVCSAAGAAVTVRGAGTGQVGGAVAIQGGLVLSLKGMDQILSLDAGAGTMTVQPGVLLQDVKAAADKVGLYYPPDPGEQTATIGGNAATNAAGPCAVKYGRTRDYILDAEIVKADGSIVRLAGNEAVLGSEGTLGVITELTLKLLPKPGASAILLFPFLDSDSCLAAAVKLKSCDCTFATLEYMDTDLVEFSGSVTGNPVFPVELNGDRVGATLMVTLEADDDDAVMEQMEQLAEMAEELECLDILVGDSPTMIREFWAAHAAFHTSMESGCKSAWEVNVDLPTEAIAEMVRFSKAVAEEKGMKALIHAHAGSGGTHIHLASDLPRTEAASVAHELYDMLYAKVAKLGGDTRGEYGIGYAKIAYLSEEARASCAAAKANFDPMGILNPGKIL